MVYRETLKNEDVSLTLILFELVAHECFSLGKHYSSMPTRRIKRRNDRICTSLVVPRAYAGSNVIWAQIAFVRLVSMCAPEPSHLARPAWAKTRGCAEGIFKYKIIENEVSVRVRMISVGV